MSSMIRTPPKMLRPSNLEGLAEQAEQPVNLEELLNVGHRIGGEIKNLRKARGITLDALSDAAGLSKGYLSQNERGVSSPSVKALHSISRALGVTISWFFPPKADDDSDLRDYVVRASSRRKLTFVGGITDELLSPNLGRQLELLRCTFPPGSESGKEPYTHQGEEAGYVISGGRRKDEKIIHSIFFPMRKDSTEIADHDIWLLSEEYHYYDYIASDVPLASIRWNDSESVFENDIDREFQKLLAKRADDNGGKRPDIALFSKEGSAIIVEFKAPGVSMDEHVGDLSEYAHLLAAKSGGRLRKFYGYLIGDTVNPLRLSGTWTPFSVGQGWFQSSPLLDPRTRQPLGRDLL
ncbi:helix-turn-helix domain-containing protein [Bradyrhizobium sp. LA7.1]|uniref:helix-turn-helix domain-containing protein n=1 Tax=Bradyrhizobium sp. LA7.1 TaxID=3156324 RepID=UPI0033943E77